MSPPVDIHGSQEGAEITRSFGNLVIDTRGNAKMKRQFDANRPHEPLCWHVPRASIIHDQLEIVGRDLMKEGEIDRGEGRGEAYGFGGSSSAILN